MAFKRGDGFDLYSGISTGGFPLSTVYTFGSSGFLSGHAPIYELIAGRFGGQALRIYDSHSSISLAGVVWANRPLVAAGASLTASVGYRRTARNIGDTGDGVRVLRLRTGTALQLSWGLDFLGRVCLWNERTGARIGRSPDVDQVLAGNWHTWDAEIAGLGTDAGRVGIWIDGGREALGVTDLDLTALDPAGADNLDLCMEQTGGANLTADFDDYYELDVAARLAQPIKAETLRPNLDAAPNQATPTTGTDHFAMIDDATGDGDATALTFGAAGQKERVGLTNLSTVPAAIFALQAITVSRKTDAGLVQQVTKFVSGPTVEDGHTQTLGINYAPEYDVTEVDPDTTTALNATGVNAIELEVERTA